ncbi:TIGR04283 family arsenosugar biosynthesis glycosyltransferase [Aphanizomenon flos-aquae NRERC-008]|uniref:4,4'-diaponeurosporenoate glycosyltransferase n=1 Tax=Aphanizomenon flos-aquae FACHB-1249 TaxID=2692889 RepID=A0ABR8IQH5_APHFL|nr:MULTISPECIES: TIGR04283 family arsenosugar biosynthesis glycosyltransferase [Aphanizomenon]MBD2390102.1 TIGR04283 family arsenosugar biosynthesis glycosyltransferase [Aphanizomenon flos-aquae FACHB-1171]MBD2556604.1 TIGR04283 family arsenosugar biosynthesis glycosyltransferase [Aphanizomenon flos-aquae FACHB-1290]MBD2631184.1 TIGR04283 family arsenosugar biosynthesis glycosyltransferase [Aphanizomenon sp. FACHB-1399]MBD2642000.1 TIGR04283 family arsenosugar biosynthesis glycosyltransferase [
MTKIINQNFNRDLISIIIPTLNEADNIQEAIISSQIGSHIEIIIVDGGSQDQTLLIAKSLNVQAIISSPGRAHQMNAGAMAASGEILLFLHADTRLPTNFDQMIRTTLAKPGIVAGAFTLQINSPHWGLRLVEFGVKWRCNLWQMPYGDQGIFLTKDVFQQVGNFPQIPIMEDFELMRKLKTLGKIYLLPTPVITSPRRWLKKGILQTTLGNQIIIIAYLLGISPNQIRNWYSSPKL